MAVLIPALGSCAGRMTSGERRLAERLQQKLEDDYLLWWDVPVGPLQTRPDFIVIHPRRGALILETKDWRLDTIKSATPQRFEIIPDGRLTVKPNPLTQARHGAIRVVNALEADPQLIHGEGPHQGKLAFPWGHGVVLTRITRKQFMTAGLDAAIPEHLVICQDEMLEDVDAEAFQQRLWDMFPHSFGRAITLPQLDRIRWILFPEVRVPQQQKLFGDDACQDEDELPDIMRVMDLQQEQLARSLGDGHRVIHGVAGSGKTMILGYRAEHLAQTQGLGSKPILVLCYNEPLGVKLAASMETKGLQDRVHVRHFHKWCREQLVTYNLLPEDANKWPVGKAMEEFVLRVIKGVDEKHIPAGQYHAILIDEGHDFAPEWLKLVTQMVDPSTNSLLLLYDDAQSIYDRGQKRNFSLKSVGIQASGRTTILKINYRNTRQILQLAHRVAGDMLTPEDAKDEDGIPLLKPLSCGREGPEPIVIDLPTLPERAARVAELLADQHAQGHAWGEMAVLCRHKDELWVCSDALRRKGLPHKVRERSGQFKPAEDSIKVMTMHSSKGLEWPVVAVVTSDEERKARDVKKDSALEARLVYVASTRAINKMVYL
ncbi:NERD domain-containing protein [Comamonas thiooxydans]|uniref:DEAD/DEAH box helicase n=1 Tax=Comamonas thiooxydans TaxID=363952 RepID=UPI000AA883F3|nr:3'-5' exonuclease [Comamonas thiooxydans]